MSSSDFKKYAVIVKKKFVGHHLALNLPTNSLVLKPGSRHSDLFLWIDPPWELLRGSDLVATGANYPDPRGLKYRAKHEAWGHHVRSLLDGALLKAVIKLPGDRTEFRFSNDLRLTVWHQYRDSGESWYDDWYTSEQQLKRKPPNKALLRTRATRKPRSSRR